MRRPVAIGRDPAVHLCGKVFQLLGLDAGHEFLLFGRQGEGVVKVTRRDCQGRVAQKRFAEPAIDGSSAEQLIQTFVRHGHVTFLVPPFSSEEDKLPLSSNWVGQG